jgi:hypothetical protein
VRIPVPVLVGVATLLTRVPFLFDAGLGSDPDAWRLALAGRYLADTGEYRTSRPPGYPLVELVAAGLHGAPWWVFTAATAVVGAVGVGALADLARQLGIRWWPVAAAGTALTPVVLRASTSFMDYTWSFGFLMVALALAARLRWTAAGAAFGLAVAARPATAVCAVVVAVVLAGLRRPREDWARFAVAATVAAGMFLVVPLSAFGPAVVSAADEHVSLTVAVGRMTTGVWGGFGVLAVLVGAGVAVWRWHARAVWMPAALAGVLAVTALFALLPADPGYLIPAVPLAWLVLAEALPGSVAVVVVTAVATSCFVAPSPSPVFGRTAVADLALRRDNEARAVAGRESIARLPLGAGVVAGSRMPELIAGLDPAVLEDPALTGPARSLQMPRRVRLPGGQLIGYAATDLPDAVVLFRLPEAPGTEPVLDQARAA